MQQAEDFRAECDALHAILEPLLEEDFDRSTGFKGWTINEILRHLYAWNWAADKSLQGADAFDDFMRQVLPHVPQRGLRAFESRWLDGLSGRALLTAWRRGYAETADLFEPVDPSMRVKWAGPSMSARSSITARLMETWAHSQAIYDVLGLHRDNTDRIRNIAVLGFNTYGWTFKNRGEAVPEPAPFVRLTAPSGAIWDFGEESAEERVEGPAEAFCQVVTQTRNVLDTALKLTGPNANRWMAVAQCFAGPPETPPAPGTRTVRVLAETR